MARSPWGREAGRRGPVAVAVTGVAFVGLWRLRRPIVPVIAASALRGLLVEGLR